jgi:hypothetical protein
MKGYSVKRFDTVATDINTLCEEIEQILNEKDIESINTFTTGRWLVLIVVFGNA